MIGSVLTLGSVFSVADAVLFLLALFTIVGLYLLAPVTQQVIRYREKIRTGEVVDIAEKAL